MAWEKIPVDRMEMMSLLGLVYAHTAVRHVPGICLSRDRQIICRKVRHCKADRLRVMEKGIKKAGRPPGRRKRRNVTFMISDEAYDAYRQIKDSGRKVTPLLESLLIQKKEG